VIRTLVRSWATVRPQGSQVATMATQLFSEASSSGPPFDLAGLAVSLGHLLKHDPKLKILRKNFMEAEAYL